MADDTSPNGSAPTADLVNRAASQISALVRAELALARSEVTEKARSAGVGGGLFGAAGVLSLYGVGLLIVLAVVGLDAVWPLWAAVLTVAVVVFAAAGVAALTGRAKVRRATPLAPTEAVEGVAADVQTVKEAARRGQNS